MVSKLRKINYALIDKLSKMNRQDLYKYLGIQTKAFFSANPIKEMALYTRRGSDDDFSRYYDRDVTFELYQYLIYKAKFFENLNLCVYSAQQRSGKSTIALSLALFFTKLINYLFSVRDIYGSQITRLSDIGNREFNSISITDEYVETHAQIGSYLGDSALRDISKITAKELLHDIQIYRFLPQDTNALIALEPIGKDFKNSQNKCLVYDIESFENDFNKVLLGYAIIPAYDKTIGKINHFDLTKLKKLTEIQKFRLAYEKKKDAWNKDIVLRKPTDRLKERQDYAKKLLNDGLFNSVKKQHHKVVIARSLCPSDFSEEELREVITMAELEKIKKEFGDISGKLENYI